MSLVGNWQREAARFTPGLRVHVHHGSDRLDGDELAAALDQTDLVITTYGVATRDQAALSTLTWARVVWDEAQTLDTRTARGLRCVLNMPCSPASAEGRPPCAGLRRAYGPRQQQRFAGPRPSEGCLTCW